MSELIQMLRAASEDERLSDGMLYRRAADRIEQLESRDRWIPEGWKVERGSEEYREIVITAPDGEQAIIDAELDSLSNTLMHLALSEPPKEQQ